MEGLVEGAWEGRGGMGWEDWSYFEWGTGGCSGGC